MFDLRSLWTRRNGKLFPTFSISLVGNELEMTDCGTRKTFFPNLFCSGTKTSTSESSKEVFLWIGWEALWLNFNNSSHWGERQLSCGPTQFNELHQLLLACFKSFKFAFTEASKNNIAICFHTRVSAFITTIINWKQLKVIHWSNFHIFVHFFAMLR